MTEEAVVNLVLQVLHQQGPMPIGEVGKHLQAMTNNIGTKSPLFSNIHFIFSLLYSERFSESVEEAIRRLEEVHFVSSGTV